MSVLDDLSRLKHIKDACQEALSFIEGYDRAALSRNRMLALSLVKELEIIGEAANNISKDCQDRSLSSSSLESDCGHEKSPDSCIFWY